MTFLDHIKAWFRGGLDGILVDLNSTIAKLEKHTIYHNQQGADAIREASKLRIEADETEKGADGFFAEANKSAAIRDRIAALVA